MDQARWHGLPYWVRGGVKLSLSSLILGFLGAGLMDFVEPQFCREAACAVTPGGMLYTAMMWPMPVLAQVFYFFAGALGSNIYHTAGWGYEKYVKAPLPFMRHGRRWKYFWRPNIFKVVASVGVTTIAAEAIWNGGLAASCGAYSFCPPPLNLAWWIVVWPELFFVRAFDWGGIVASIFWFYFVACFAWWAIMKLVRAYRHVLRRGAAA